MLFVDLSANYTLSITEEDDCVMEHARDCPTPLSRIVCEDDDEALHLQAFELEHVLNQAAHRPAA